MSRQVPHVEDIATGTPTAGLVPVSAGAGLAPAWGAGSGGGGGLVTLIEKKLLLAPAADLSFDPIPQTSEHLWLRAVLRGAASAFTTGLNIIANNDNTSGHYAWARHQVVYVSGGSQHDVSGLQGDAVWAFGDIPAGSATAGNFAFLDLHLPYYTSTVHNKAFRATLTLGSNSDQMYVWGISGWRKGTGSLDPVTALKLFAGVSGANFATGSCLWLYGM